MAPRILNKGGQGDAVLAGQRGAGDIGAPAGQSRAHCIVKGDTGGRTGGPGEREDFIAALDYMAAKYPGVPLWAAGFSFGSWVALETGATDDRVRVLIGIAPPVTREGYDFSNTIRSTKPKFFVQGEADEVCPLEGMWAFYGKLKEPKELVVIDAADHLYEAKTQEVGEALEGLLAGF